MPGPEITPRPKITPLLWTLANVSAQGLVTAFMGYLLYCPECPTVYVGQTGYRIRDRQTLPELHCTHTANLSSQALPRSRPSGKPLSESRCTHEHTSVDHLLSGEGRFWSNDDGCGPG